MKEFPTAKMDNRTKVFTFIFVLLAILAVYLLYFYSDFEKEFIWIPIVFLIAAGVAAYLMSPKIFIVNNVIYIKSKFTSVRIPVKDVAGIKRFPEVGLNFRLFGVGGVFGYFGYFNGGDVWYVTNIYKKVKIKTGKKLYVISPENPEEFINEVNKIKQNLI